MYEIRYVLYDKLYTVISILISRILLELVPPHAKRIIFSEQKFARTCVRLNLTGQTPVTLEQT